MKISSFQDSKWVQYMQNMFTQKLNNNEFSSVSICSFARERVFGFPTQMQCGCQPSSFRTTVLERNIYCCSSLMERWDMQYLKTRIFHTKNSLSSLLLGGPLPSGVPLWSPTTGEPWHLGGGKWSNCSQLPPWTCCLAQPPCPISGLQQHLHVLWWVWQPEWLTVYRNCANNQQLLCASVCKITAHNVS